MCLRCYEMSRRSLLAGGGIAAASLTTGVAQARVRPADMQPLIGAGFKPTDKDEIGLWQQMERVEEEIAGSNLLIKDPQLTAYLQDLIGKVGGPAAKDLRIYLARIPEFNAFMFPTGFSVVFSGLLLRMRNEAQLGGRDRARIGPFPAPAHDPVVARHEAQERHFRDRRDGCRRRRRRGRGLYRRYRPAGAARHDPVAVPLQSPDGGRGRRHGRPLLAENGYPAIEMANIWEQLIGEEDASALHRRKRRDRGSIFRYPPVARELEWPTSRPRPRR